MPTRSYVRNPALRLAFAATALSATAAWAMPGFGPWSQPAVNAETLPQSAPNVNTPAVDGCVSLTRDGLRIFFNSNRAGTQDIYTATRPDTESGFGSPERLPEPVNTTTNDEFCPTAAHGNRLYFSRAANGDIGDLYMSHYGPSGFSDPESPGSGINSAMMDEAAAFFEDDAGQRVMLFSRRRADGTGGQILASVDGGPAVPLDGSPNAAGSNNRPSITHDGLTLFFDSTRPGGLGGPDLYVATRESTADPFGPAQHLAGLSSTGFDARPTISWDGTELFFSSGRAGSESAAPDIWRTSRSKVRGPKVITF